MQTKTLSQRLRTRIKPFADRLGIGASLRQAHVETLMSGERLKFLFTGRPPISSTILLAGSGRSGTTWLADALCMLPGVQQIFEPLHPRFNPDVMRITSRNWGGNPQNRIDSPTYLPIEPEAPEWTVAIERALTGRTRNYFTDSARTAFLPNRFLVKDIWSNLMLGYIAKRFSPRIVYILRHPCAVVHSRLGVKWTANVQDILAQTQLVQDYLQDFVSDIQAEKDMVGAHAVWWALENHVALQQLQQFPHFVIYYEDLILQPREILEQLVAWLGYEKIPPAMNLLLDKPSRTSNQIMVNHGNSDRFSIWQTELSQSDQYRVLQWAERLGLNMYNTAALPCVPFFTRYHDVSNK